MIIFDKKYNEIEKELADRRNAAKHEAERRTLEIYGKFPQIAEIDNTINTLGILIVYCAMKRKAPTKVVSGLPKEYLSFNKEQINQLIIEFKNKKCDILEKAGYPCDYLENAHFCKNCHDTGAFLQNGIEVDCECKAFLISKKLKELSGVAEGDVFSCFRSDFYSDIVDKEKYGIAVSPKTQMEAIYKRCIYFVQNFDSPSTHNMVFFGNSGLGKTFLGNCIINALTDKGISCLYMPATSLFKPFTPSYSGQENASDLVEFILNCSLLLIDDLGSEKQTDTRYAELLEILNTRELNSKKGLCKTIITTNLEPKELFSRYGERVASRILGDYDINKFAGDDIRLKKKSM